ncbi:hypothetical protein, partial [Leptospira sp. Fiocruz LV3954]|uniref:hypothetical protein n=1 Tax=Leptospira sp. Fiocruz LV3954 TaxID=1193012 RepID=UPI0012EA464A
LDSRVLCFLLVSFSPAFTCFLDAFWMLSGCFLDAFWMLSGCFLDAFWMLSGDFVFDISLLQTILFALFAIMTLFQGRLFTDSERSTLIPKLQ